MKVLDLVLAGADVRVDSDSTTYGAGGGSYGAGCCGGTGLGYGHACSVRAVRWRTSPISTIAEG